MLNVLTLNLLFNVFGINRYGANLMAIAAVTLWNFWLNLKLSWRVTDAKPTPSIQQSPYPFQTADSSNQEHRPPNVTEIQ